MGLGRGIGKGFCGWLEGRFGRVEAKWLGMRMDGMKDRRKWDEIRKKRLLCLYYHSPILLLGFSYDAGLTGEGWGKERGGCGVPPREG